jgi:hypothetical protein
MSLKLFHLLLIIMTASILQGQALANPLVGFKCKRYVSQIDRFYDLAPINYDDNLLNIPYSFKTPDKSQFSPYIGSKGSINIGGCEARNSELGTCNSEYQSIGWAQGILPNGNTFCTPLSTNANDLPGMGPTQWSFLPLNAEGNVIPATESTKSGNGTGIRILGKNLTINAIPFDIHINMKCDLSSAEARGMTPNWDQTSKVLSVDFYHSGACGKTQYSFLNSLGWWKYLTLSLATFVSFLMLLFSERFYKTSLAITGLTMGCGVTMLLMAGLYKPGDNWSWYSYITLAIISIIGLSIGYFMAVYPKFGAIGNKNFFLTQNRLRVCNWPHCRGFTV